MKKSFLLLGIAFSILSLSSCHTPYSLDSFKVPTEFDESKDYNIEFWAKNDDYLERIAILSTADRIDGRTGAKVYRVYKVYINM